MRADPGAQQQLLRQPQPAAAADDDRVALLAVARPFLRDAPVADPHDAVGDRVDSGSWLTITVVSVLAHELGEHVVHLVGLLAVQLAGRLVGEEYARPVSERGAERDALLLAARQLARFAAALVGEADALEQLVCAARALGPRVPCRPELQRHELLRGQLGRERAAVVLVGVAEQRRAVARELSRGQLRRSSPCTFTCPAEGR